MDTPDSLDQAIAKVVSRSLREAGISQRDASERTGIPMTTLGRRLTGRAPMDTAELHALAQLAGRSVSEIVAEAEARLVA